MPPLSFAACSVGWFVSLLVCEEVLLAGSCERKILFRLEIYEGVGAMCSSSARVLSCLYGVKIGGYECYVWDLGCVG